MSIVVGGDQYASTVSWSRGQVTSVRQSDRQNGIREEVMHPQLHSGQRRPVRDRISRLNATDTASVYTADRSSGTPPPLPVFRSFV